MIESRRKYDILVVEDNPGDAHLIGEAFAECGQECRLTFAESFEQAGRFLLDGWFDLIVSDMGAEDQCSALIGAVRSSKRLKAVPIVIVSGSHNPRPAYEAGANVFILKTIDMDLFFTRIRSLMHFWTDVAELPTEGSFSLA